MISENPLVSVITVVYNGAETVERTIKSVLSQTYTNFEYIVIDGGSTDGTCETLEKYLNNFSFYVSEPDSGIYNAWNKGVDKAKGEILCFCNADDFYAEDAIENAVSSMEGECAVVAYGATRFFSSSGEGRENTPYFDERSLVKGFGFMTTSAFFSKDLFESVGLFDESYKIAGDTEWMLRCYRAGAKFIKSNAVTYMSEDGVSARFYILALEEYSRALISKGFDKVEVLDVKKKKIFRYRLKSFLNFVGFSFFCRTLRNANRVAVNVMINAAPSFFLKRVILRFLGARVEGNVCFHFPVKLFSSKARLDIGNNSTINSGCVLDTRGSIKIGKNVSISQGVKMYTGGHDVDCPIFRYTNKPIVIADYAVIFSWAMIMPGVRVGFGAVVLPGSVVTKDVGDYQVVGGNPAKVVKDRSHNLVYRLNHSAWFSL